jgi:hypothetical protein
MAKLRLMTHNQWKCDNNQPAWEADGFDCSVGVRTKGFIRVYKDTLPDIIGCQESSFAMVDKMIRYAAAEGLRYALLWGRDTPIVYRPDKFELVDSDFSLFPDEFPGHEGIFNNSQTKSWTLGVFRIKENGKLLIFVSTHLWWKSGNPASGHYQPYSDEARQYQLNIVMEKVAQYRAKYNCPAVVVGDLNANYNSLAVQHALANGYVHAHDIAVEFADETMGYHYCFPSGFKTEYYDKPFPDAIDHILVIGAEDGFVRRFERFSPDYYFPLSDHSPAFADVEI